MITLNFNVGNDGSTKSSTNAIDVFQTSENRPNPMQMEGSLNSASNNIPSPQSIFGGNEKSSLEESAPHPDGFGGSLTENSDLVPSPHMETAFATSSGEESAPRPMDFEELVSKPAATKTKAKASKTTSK